MKWRESCGKGEGVMADYNVLWLITMCCGVILVCLQGFKGVNLIYPLIFIFL